MSGTTPLTMSMREAAPASAFAALQPQAPDALLGLIALYGADPRADKIDLGVGVFRDYAGQTPVMGAVKSAEQLLIAEQTTKAYLGPDGDTIYTDLLAAIALGHRLAASDRLTGVQTPGGTGALRLGAELLARADPTASVWVGTPTWPVHAPLFHEAGLRVRAYRFYDAATARLDFEGMMADLGEARPGDALLLHGCCHNPTGADFSPAQWEAIAELCAARALIAIVDLAYQGLGDGLEEDAGPTRMLLDRVPDALLAYSCDKNFGLYRERVGALWVQAATASAIPAVRGNMLTLARSLWSMPPDHGAAIVRIVLSSPSLRDQWRAELAAMRDRINGIRAAVGAAHPALSFIAQQRGMFALLPVSPAAVVAMREQNGIYMAGNGRINLAGLRLDTMSHFIAGLAPHLR